jgi:hypothetical protein
MPRARTRRAVALVGLAVMLVAPVQGAGAAITRVKTAQHPMLFGIPGRAWVDPIITVGEKVGLNYMFDAIPDGISVRAGVTGTVQVFVNHETSTVPFPYAPTVAATEANSQNDFTNSKLSRLIIDRDRATIRAATTVIRASQGYHRFCSNFLATAAQGFNRELLFTNEEAVDWVKRSGSPSWPATEGASDARQAGVVVAYDPRANTSRPIWGMGRLNHENSVAIPGYGKPVVLTTDDTFVTTPSQSQLYSYIARNANAVWNDLGGLWAFVGNGKDEYEDFAPGSTETISGRFIKVPRLIATGRNRDGSEVMGDDAEAFFGTPGAYDVPMNGSFSRPPGVPGNPPLASSPSVDGPQWVLERWSQLNGVFKFVRLEDVAYDKRPGRQNVVYLVDSGRGTTGAVGAGKSTNGRVWQMILSKTDPTRVTSLRILIEGDDNPVKTRSEVHQPDNIETTVNGIYLTEDPGSSQQFSFTDPMQVNDPARTEARIWQYRFANRRLRVVARVDQSADEGTTDVDAAARGNIGAWEASGIIDVSRWFGPGTFLVTVQAHTLWVEKDGPADGKGHEGQHWWRKREGGQLVLLRIPNG